VAAPRTGSPTAIGVARLVRARHGAPRTTTVPSGLIAVRASPSSPIIHSRPIVGVENRVRTMAGIPAIIATVTPSTPATRVIQDIDTPSYSNSDPNANDTVAMPVHRRGTPVWMSTA